MLLIKDTYINLKNVNNNLKKIIINNMEKNNITLILPVHEINEDLKKYFTIAVNSVKTQLVLPDELLIVIKPDTDVKEFINSFDYTQIKPTEKRKDIESVDITNIVRIIENTTGEYDFASQMNFAVKNVNTEWFSLLEIDDELSKIWFKNAVKYMKSYEDVDIFLPIIFDVDASGTYGGLTNEAVWAPGFGDEVSLWDNQKLHQWQRVNFDGMVMKKDKYLEIGGIKRKIILTFMYEFFLRATYKSLVIMTIPKIGYKHVNQRPDSLFNNLVKVLNPEESNFWLNTAKKEYYFDKDRDIPNFIISK